MSTIQPTEFERVAKDGRDPGLTSDLLGFLRHHRKWWLVPLFLLFLFFGVLVLASQTGLAPFIYTLF